uniref:Nuclear receptor domain-containing protein n=2 Tax=Meloidogyne enterolobii TaxID=390850 RepID=A0A6V7Y907_MELEN|nr:unnamed protein product [Meloidogyne enterolobii]
MQRNIIKKCKVCESTISVCFHYGVCTCRACGSFFRRYLLNEHACKYNECKCSKENKDEKSQTNLAKCKKCRLEKCFSVGMKRLDVGYVRQDICREAMEGKGNEIKVKVYFLIMTDPYTLT